MDEEEILDRLYGLPLTEFTAARNQTVKELRAAGDKELAQRVQKLAKPTLPAWAINQLARRGNERIGRLVEVQDALASASSAPELRRLAAERRALVTELAHLAESILVDSRHSAGSTTMQQISQTLLAGASDEEQELLTKGRLTKELTSSGLDQVWELGGADAAGDEPEETDGTDAPRRRKAEELTYKARQALREAQRLEAEAQDARSRAERAEKSAARARRRAEKAEDQAAAARREAGLED